ncbi:MAG: DUF938 domain-containing protein [Nannocystaceae bacterium]
MSDARLFFPATERNRDALIAALDPWLPQEGTLLEIASGSGEHLTYFAAEGLRPKLRWIPSDPDPEHLASIDAWRRERGVGEQVAPALELDVTRTPWSVPEVDALLCCNMIHIAPWEACLGLLRGAAQVLSPGAPFLLYGPFMRHGQHTAPSNEAFDARLQERDPRWGVRDLEVVTAEAATHGLVRRHIEPMPANNLCAVFHRTNDAV